MSLIANGYMKDSGLPSGDFSDTAAFPLGTASNEQLPLCADLGSGNAVDGGCLVVGGWWDVTNEGSWHVFFLDFAHIRSTLLPVELPEILER
jgi:hypothetical protein